MLKSILSIRKITFLLRLSLPHLDGLLSGGQVGHTVQCDPSRPENLLYYPLQVYDESPIV